MSQVININQTVFPESAQKVAERVRNIAYPVINAASEAVGAILEEQKQETIHAIREFAAYRDKRQTVEMIVKRIAQNRKEHGKAVDFVEKKHVTPDDLESFVKLGGVIEPEIDPEELAEYRKDLKIATCCFADRIDFSKFIRLEIPINVTLKAI